MHSKSKNIFTIKTKFITAKHEADLDHIFSRFDLGTEFVLAVSGDGLSVRALPLRVVDDPSLG